MSISPVTIEEITDPDEIVYFHAHRERYLRNDAVFRERRAEIYRDHRGKVVVIAGAELHAADTAEAAWSWARQTHPEDDGVLVRYIPKTKGWRIYADQWRVVRM